MTRPDRLHVGHTCLTIASVMTPDQLSALLRRVNAAAVAADSGVSVKTIYRLRHKANSPNLATMAKLVGSIERLQPDAFGPQSSTGAGG